MCELRVSCIRNQSSPLTWNTNILKHFVELTIGHYKAAFHEFAVDAACSLLSDASSRQPYSCHATLRQFDDLAAQLV
eukprot:scaffold297388_cov39-Prasinocladus_malaysianus.AAC.1